MHKSLEGFPIRLNDDILLYLSVLKVVYHFPINATNLQVARKFLEDYYLNPEPLDFYCYKCQRMKYHKPFKPNYVSIKKGDKKKIEKMMKNTPFLEGYDKISLIASILYTKYNKYLNREASILGGDCNKESKCFDAS